MSTVAVVDIPQMVRQYIANRPDGSDVDPKTIAEELVQNLDAEDLVAIARMTLPSYVRSEMRSMRHTSQRQIGRPRMAAAAQLQQEGLLPLLKTSWCIDGEWVPLGEIDRRGAEWLREDYKARAKSNIEKAKRFAWLAKVLKDGQTAKDLPQDILERIFDPSQAADA